MDEDGNKTISWEEFLKFWKNVVGSGYPEEDILEEVDMMLEGGELSSPATAVSCRPHRLRLPAPALSASRPLSDRRVVG